MAINHPAEIIAKNQIIHHFTISFHFLIFSSSPTLIVNIKAPYTIDQTAIRERNILMFFIQFKILFLNHQFNLLNELIHFG